jgi:hypothetical protein
MMFVPLPSRADPNDLAARASFGQILCDAAEAKVTISDVGFGAVDTSL